MHELDKIDRKILEALQADASLTNLELAEKVCLSPSPCSRRVKILQEKGFFRGQVTLLDPQKVGLPVSVFIQVTLNHQVKKNLVAFEETVKDWPEVMECYLMTGDFDYLIRVAVPDLNAYQDFLDKRLTPMDGIDSIRTSFSLKQVRYKTELPLNHLGTRSG
ncbi:Lrp/AsnC family transcriptional regulator [Pseudomaricurvus alkylphenolicus]|jgi:DNA-binding Lrp family transcriptional regulator|uniref:Lrp/AsnC family transcriptional regulator n=1 Tax=Pseudomaricurvus alkylphenolicus TaxID=1306991 RepID=UPI0014230732|nr:Lrp/AsnC family transcriptional regulator [Pseudomaricurvus alkylphenolicus]NIB43608.1 Lrp/AsnC family transcriptional regulator [Pseudomaricurvus alkylphenolicus]